MKNNKTSVGIIGIGAIGSYFALKMKLSGLTPVLFTKQNESSPLKIIYRENGRFFENHFAIGNPSVNNKFDFLFITVKSYNLSTIIKNYKLLIDNSKRIILVQSNINLTSYDWGKNIDKLYYAPVMIGVLGDFRSIIYELNKGHILLGKANNKVNNEIEVVKDKLSNVSKIVISDNIEFDLFLKVIINTALFPLSILNSCSFGTIYRENANVDFASRIFHECILVAKKHFKNQNILIDNIELESITQSKSSTIIKEKINKYSTIFPSVLLDILKEKKETELKYFYEDIILLAERYKVEISNTKKAKDILNCFCKKRTFFNLKNIDEIMKNYRQQCI